MSRKKRKTRKQKERAKKRMAKRAALPSHDRKSPVSKISEKAYTGPKCLTGYYFEKFKYGGCSGIERHLRDGFLAIEALDYERAGFLLSRVRDNCRINRIDQRLNLGTHTIVQYDTSGLGVLAQAVGGLTLIDIINNPEEGVAGRFFDFIDEMNTYLRIKNSPHLDTQESVYYIKWLFNRSLSTLQKLGLHDLVRDTLDDIRNSDKKEISEWASAHLAVSYYEGGDYGAAKEVFDSIFDYSDPEKFMGTMDRISEVESPRDYFAEDFRRQRLFMINIYLSLNAVYSTSTNEEQKKFKDFFESYWVYFDSVLEQNGVPDESIDLTRNGMKASIALMDPEAHNPLMEGRTKNTVFSCNDYVFKVGEDTEITDEFNILYYFKLLRRGVINPEDPFQDKVTLDPSDDPNYRPLPRRDRFNIPYSAVQLGMIPPHIRDLFPGHDVITSYGHLPGKNLMEFLGETDDAETLKCVYSDTLEQLALLHALGPKHVLDEVPFVKRHDAEKYKKGVKKLMDRAEDGFDEPDQAVVMDSFDIIAGSLGDRKFDSYVKDANPGNWIISDERKITAIDFETYGIAGPQYDLVKLLEHYSDMSIEQNHSMVRDYIKCYNEAAAEFNAVTPENIHKPLIEDTEEFLFIYENYVIDHVIKSLHRDKYNHPDCNNLKVDWMKRGKQAIEYIVANKEHAIGDKGKLIKLHDIFDKYEGTIGDRIAA